MATLTRRATAHLHQSRHFLQQTTSATATTTPKRTITTPSTTPPPIRPLPSEPTQGQRRYLSAFGYEQAKALLYTDYGEPSSVLHLHGHSISPAHSSLATIRFLASPLNPADINTIQGVYPSKPPFTTALSTQAPAAVAGNEGVAEVLSVGGNAFTATGAKLEKGDWVIMGRNSFGTWRTHAQAEAGDLVKVEQAEREGVSAIAVGTVSVNPCTAWAILRGYVGGGATSDGVGGQPGRAPQQGEWFIQNGANSGVGRAAIQLGRAWGLKSINVIRARPGDNGEAETKKLKDELRELGADVVVTEEEATEKTFPEFVKSTTDNGREQVTLALNCVGGRSALNLMKVLASKGWHVTYGAMAKQPLSIPAGMLIFKDLRYAGFWVSRWSQAFQGEKVRAVKEVLNLTRDGMFKDMPFQEVRWDYNTEEAVLKEAVQGTLEGFRSGKSVFVFGDT